MASTPAPPPSLKLTYFNIQGVAEKVRLAFVLGGIEFEDERVPFPEWGALKPSTPYGQLPLLSIGGGRPVAQSDAMLRYAGGLATELGVPLYPAERLLEVEEALGLVGDIQRDFRPAVQVALEPEVFGNAAEVKGTEEHAALVKAARAHFMATAFPKYMRILEARLADGSFLCGSDPTIADCMLIPILNRFASGGVDHIPKDCLESYPTVTGYVARFMNLAPVKAWYDNASV